jgi:hypothetical protein
VVWRFKITVVADLPAERFVRTHGDATNASDPLRALGTASRSK